MLRKGLIARTSLVAAAAIAAPAQADVVQVINDSVPSMALTNTSTPTTIGGPQMQTNNRFSSQIWTREFSGATGGGFLLRNKPSLSQPSVCLRDKPNGLATAGVRLSTCNSFASEISWTINASRQLINVGTGRALTVLPNNGFFANLQMQSPSNVPAKRWTMPLCGPGAC
jgi:hypothetical protein